MSEHEGQVLRGALVGVIMGSRSDWRWARVAAETLAEYAIPYEARIVSAHRTPERMRVYATSAQARGLRVIIACAGGAAHLPGMTAAMTDIPVIGVPMPTTLLAGGDAVASILQMPAGTPVATMAIGEPGAANAAHLAARILALHDEALAARLRARREEIARLTPDAPA